MTRHGLSAATTRAGAVDGARQQARRELSSPRRERRSMRADAFEELFELHFDAVYGYLARRVGPDLGGELASETFVRAFAARKRYDAARGEVRPWLLGIAHNLLRRHYRDEERRLRALARLDVPRAELPRTEPR